MTQFSDIFRECSVECERGHTFESPCQYRLVAAQDPILGTVDVRYTCIKQGVLGTLPSRLGELVRRTHNDADRTLLLSTIDRLDALAGDAAYHMTTEGG